MLKRAGRARLSALLAMVPVSKRSGAMAWFAVEDESEDGTLAREGNTTGGN
jgi:hypothetical protein